MRSRYQITVTSRYLDSVLYHVGLSLRCVVQKTGTAETIKPNASSFEVTQTLNALHERYLSSFQPLC